MQRLRAAAVVVISFGFLSAGCATVSTVEPDEEALLKVDREWAAAAAEGKDVERIVSFWSHDATVFPAGGPVLHGKPAIRAYVEKSLALPGFQISWSSEQASVSADGTLGYTTGTNSLTVPGPDGTLITGTGRGVAVWRRIPDGEWKCVVDIWNFGQ